MKKLSWLIGFLSAVIIAGCATPAKPPAFISMAARWQRVPKDLAAPVVYSVPGMDQAKYARIPYKPGFSMDVYYPAHFSFGGETLPVVVFTIGYSADTTKAWFGADLKDLGQYVSWGSLMAASGMIGIAYQTNFPDDDLDAVLGFVRGQGKPCGMDRDRIGIFTCSGNTNAGLTALTEKTADFHAGVRCGVVYYPIIAYFQNKGEQAMQVPFQRELRRDVPIGRAGVEISPPPNAPSLIPRSPRTG